MGEGKQAGDIEAALRRIQLPHVQLQRGWLSEADLIQRHILPTDVCLGLFGSGPKARDVVPAKVYLALACGRGTVTADTPAAREALEYIACPWRPNSPLPTR